MSQNPDIFDLHDKEVNNIIQRIKTLANQDVSQVYSKKEPLATIADTIRDIDPYFFRDLLLAMKKIESENPVKPGVAYPKRS
jgi:hypothetical protein